MQRDLAYLLDIVRACRAVADFIAGFDDHAVRASDLVRSGVARKIEIIGEAPRRLSREFRAAHPEVPWCDTAEIRSRLGVIHGYDDRDSRNVREVATDDFPWQASALQTERMWRKTRGSQAVPQLTSEPAMAGTRSALSATTYLFRQERATSAPASNLAGTRRVNKPKS
jgi:uncharacterized protein with HEPN domain